MRVGPTTRGMMAAAAAALAYTLACPPHTTSWAGWIVPGVLLVPVRRLAAWRAAACGVVFALLMGIGVTGWAFHASLEYFDFNRAMAGAFVVCVWLLYGGIPFGLLLAGYARFAGGLPAATRAIIAAWAWAAMELLRTTLFTGMPWELLGHSQFRHLWLVQISDLGGAYAVSFVMTLTSVAVAEALADARVAPFKGWELPRRLAATAGLLVATYAYGVHARGLHADATQAPSVAIAIVQGNVPNAYRWQRAHMERTLSTYVTLTESTRGQHPDLVVWPENAVDFYLEREPMLRGQLGRVATLAPGGLVVGSPRLAPDGEARNSAQLLGAGGQVVAVYDKQHLVPFAESTILPWNVAEASEPVYGAGPQAEPITTSVGRLGTMICYEVLFPRLVNDLVRRGADVLVNLSNDSWLDTGDGWAREQHFSMAVFRAIETRRDLVRSASSGPSGVIDAYGRIGATLPLNVAGTLVARVHVRNTLTPYVRFGDAWIVLVGAAVAVGLWRRSHGVARA